MRKISVSDYTLKGLSERGDVSLLFREKVAVAGFIDTFGADTVELPAIKKPKEDTIIARTIAGALKNASVCMPASPDEDGIRAAWECVKDAHSPRLQLSLPVSAVQMEYTYHMKEQKMLARVAEVCKFAASLCPDVEFCALDATRADGTFLADVCRTATENGATLITVCDDAGEALPDEVKDVIALTCGAVTVPVFFRPSDSIGLGVANALAAIEAGASGIKTEVACKGGLHTERFAAVMSARGESLGLETSLIYTEIKSDISSLIRTVERGAAERAVTSPSDEYFDAETPLTRISSAVNELGYDLSDEDVARVKEALVRVSAGKGSVGLTELEAIVASTAMQVPSTYHVKGYTSTSGSSLTSVSHVVLTSGDEEFSGVATGDGPIDASFKAIEQSIGHRYELDDFRITSVTEGVEALGSALVRLRCNGKLYSGSGISENIVGASIRAYVNALNKIVYEEMSR